MRVARALSARTNGMVSEEIGSVSQCGVMNRCPAPPALIQQASTMEKLNRGFVYA